MRLSIDFCLFFRFFRFSPMTKWWCLMRRQWPKPWQLLLLLLLLPGDWVAGASDPAPGHDGFSYAHCGSSPYWRPWFGEKNRAENGKPWEVVALEYPDRSLIQLECRLGGLIGHLDTMKHIEYRQRLLYILYRSCLGTGRSLDWQRVMQRYEIAFFQFWFFQFSLT